MDIPTELSLVLESFDRNARVNRAVLDALTPEDLEISDRRGGRTINELLGELIAFRKEWLEEISPEHGKDLPWFIHIEEFSFRLTISSLEEIAAAFEQSDEAARTAVLDALAADRAFEAAYPSHPGHFLQHTIVHDSHHRGQIMMLLRQFGKTKEQMIDLDRATWPIWRERATGPGDQSRTPTSTSTSIGMPPRTMRADTFVPGACSSSDPTSEAGSGTASPARLTRMSPTIREPAAGASSAMPTINTARRPPTASAIASGTDTGCTDTPR